MLLPSTEEKRACRRHLVFYNQDRAAVVSRRDSSRAHLTLPRRMVTPAIQVGNRTAGAACKYVACKSIGLDQTAPTKELPRNSRTIESSIANADLMAVISDDETSD